MIDLFHLTHLTEWNPLFHSLNPPTVHMKLKEHTSHCQSAYTSYTTSRIWTSCLKCPVALLLSPLRLRRRGLDSRLWRVGLDVLWCSSGSTAGLGFFHWGPRNERSWGFEEQMFPLNSKLNYAAKLTATGPQPHGCWLNAKGGNKSRSGPIREPHHEIWPTSEAWW